MRTSQVGPGSSKSTWKGTLDPGKNLPCSNASGQRAAGNDTISSSGAGTNGQQVPQQPPAEQKK